MFSKAHFSLVPTTVGLLTCMEVVGAFGPSILLYMSMGSLWSVYSFVDVYESSNYFCKSQQHELTLKCTWGRCYKPFYAFRRHDTQSNDI
jgi:hypothetical protein